MREIKVLEADVTGWCIANGIERASKHCMVHLAIEVAYPKLKRVYVTKENVRATDSERNVVYTFPMSPIGRAMILQFDAGRKDKIKPFILRLRNPVVRERKFRPATAGHKPQMRVKGDTVKRHRGVVPKQDRVFGQKLWTAELNQLEAMFTK